MVPFGAAAGGGSAVEKSSGTIKPCFFSSSLSRQCSKLELTGNKKQKVF